MPLYNMPAGCLGPSDIDHAYALGYREPRCENCRQNPCECCQECGANPGQACEPECGVPENPSPELLEYWQERSELFEPSDCFEIGYIVTEVE